MSISDIEKKYISDCNGKEYIENFINVNNIKRHEIIISSTNLQYRNVLYFPKYYSNDINYQSLLFYRTFERHKAGYLIDGITVKINENSEFDNKNDSEFSLNFIGEVRPQLSIDRLNILEIPNNLQQEWDKLKENVIKDELKCICDYLNSAPQNYKKNYQILCGSIILHLGGSFSMKSLNVLANTITKLFGMNYQIILYAIQKLDYRNF